MATKKMWICKKCGMKEHKDEDMETWTLKMAIMKKKKK